MAIKTRRLRLLGGGILALAGASLLFAEQELLYACLGASRMSATGDYRLPEDVIVSEVTCLDRMYFDEKGDIKPNVMTE